MTEAPDPLQSLLAEDIKSLDRSRLAEFLQPYVQFDKNSGDVNFLPGFDSIVTNDSKMEVILSASKAKSLLFENEPDGLTPGNIISMEVMPAGSVKSSLKKLYDDRKIKKDINGRYVLPNYRISDVIERLRKEG
jgi:hypothetical protein